MRLLFGFFLILIGISALTGIDLGRYFWAIIFIFIGLRMLLGRQWWEGGRSFETKKTISDDEINEVAIFSPVNKKIKSDEFKGGNITAIFGGGEIDLSEVKIADKTIELEVVAIFGGLKIIVPKGIKVRSEGVGIIGGYDNRAESNKTDKILRIKGAAIIGGVEIVN